MGALPSSRGLLARGAFSARIGEVVAALPRPPADDRFSVLGPRPLRILLIGSGLAVGYGTTARAHALDGRLGTAVAAALGRGVMVKNQARDGVRLREQMTRATAELGFGLEDLVVWCPSHLELTERLWSRSWEADLRELLRFADGAKVLVLELSVPDGGDAVARGATRLIQRINRGIRRAAERFPDVAVVVPPAVRLGPTGFPDLTPAYYERLGAAAAEAAVTLLAPEAAHRPEP